MKRRTAYLGTSAGTITTPKPKGALARMMEAQERENSRLRGPQWCEAGCDLIGCDCRK